MSEEDRDRGAMIRTLRRDVMRALELAQWARDSLLSGEYAGAVDLLRDISKVAEHAKVPNEGQWAKPVVKERK